MVGFAPTEIDPSAPTRAARLKWVVVVDADLPAGRATNAAICTAAATSQAVSGLLGDDAMDADGNAHPGLPWAGCTVLSADATTLRTIRAKAAARPDFFVADMPAAAQQTRVYTEYLSSVAGTAAEGLDYYAVSLVGPRNPVDKLIGKLPLLA
ncbi:DUF2000 domain-containing protein [Actinoplanes sp. TRM 88003]|uniref:DUF2000 domain-containing protein n=1 Tax=Paractinoplanes aksuensis TaxID=2939490 RepID=A0ABT1DQV0_9ACTN|nr:DUF2000 domain-containing protein [Actinoplanes aksuensis]MCO8272436.1 DUF2000 domain-containing protein [Actinoplanes aksuensis]